VGKRGGKDKLTRNPRVRKENDRAQVKQIDYYCPVGLLTTRKRDLLDIGGDQSLGQLRAASLDIVSIGLRVREKTSLPPGGEEEGVGDEGERVKKIAKASLNGRRLEPLATYKLVRGKRGEGIV